jgi:hypothetical protein
MEASKVKPILLIQRIVPQKQYIGSLKEHKIDKKSCFFRQIQDQFKMTDGSNYKSLLWAE